VFEALFRTLTGRASKASAMSDGYHAFTCDFDVVVDAPRLSEVLGALSTADAKAHEEAWSAFSGALLGWRTEAHLEALAATSRLRAQFDQDDLNNTAVTILVDQSGSMRGQSMLLAAATCDVAQDWLGHLGAAVEVLGFTTTSWHGGRARRRWSARGKPKQPGRLCDLLHIIYRPATEYRSSTGGHHFKNMLRPDLPKENVDGEALQWAASRLRSIPQKRKVLLVISDGAPVDDSTLMENGPSYLHDHLKGVTQEIESSGDVILCSVGIGFDASGYYSSTARVQAPEDLGKCLIGILEAALQTNA
jgi:cobaltochelatase CobT